VARYGTFLYGAAKYGSTTNLNLLWGVEVDWDGDGLFSGASEATRVREVATQAVVTIDVEAPLKDVLALFREKRFRHVPVVRGGKPVGILSTRDFLEYLVDGFEHYIDEFRYNRALAEGTDPYDHFGGQYGG
jgi:CBS domain-containing protein